MATISAAGGLKSALSGLLGSIGGPIGATIAAGLGAALFATSELSKHEAEKQKYLDQRKKDKDQEDQVRKTWQESGLGFQVPDTVGGQAQYDVYGFSDGQTLGGNMGQAKMDEMVAAGLFKKEETATPGKFTYTPTETGRAKGYISAKALTRAGDPTFSQVSRATVDSVDALLTSSTGGLFESTPAERLGQENADQLQAMLQAGVIGEDVIAGLVEEIRKEDNRGFFASLTEWQTPFWTEYGDEGMKAKYGKIYINLF